MTYNTEINTIVTALTGVSEKYFDYEKEKKRIVADYRGYALEQSLKDIELKMSEATKLDVTIMDRAVARMIEEAKAGNHYDINDSAVANAAALLSNGGIKIEVAIDVIKAFAGNITALELIKGSAHEMYRTLFNDFIFDNVGSLEYIQFRINSLTYESADNYPSIVSQIRERLVDFATRQGIDVNVSAGALEEMRMKNICGLMGVDYESTLNK